MWVVCVWYMVMVCVWDGDGEDVEFVFGCV